MEERFGPVGNERYKEYLKDVHTSGTHVLSLVNDLLDLSKIEAGKMELAPEELDANATIGECVSIMQTQANQQRVIVRLSLAPRLPRIRADERSLRQILLNLLSNAVKFNEPGGQVIVSSAQTDAGFVVIRVKDTGIGMSDDEIDIALEPFRQVATSRKTTGTGLGLPRDQGADRGQPRLLHDQEPQERRHADRGGLPPGAEFGGGVSGGLPSPTCGRRCPCVSKGRMRVFATWLNFQRTLIRPGYAGRLLPFHGRRKIRQPSLCI